MFWPSALQVGPGNKRPLPWLFEQVVDDGDKNGGRRRATKRAAADMVDSKAKHSLDKVERTTCRAEEASTFGRSAWSDPAVFVLCFRNLLKRLHRSGRAVPCERPREHVGVFSDTNTERDGISFILDARSSHLCSRQERLANGGIVSRPGVSEECVAWGRHDESERTLDSGVAALAM